MAAYVISEVEVVDEESGQKYRELAAASIAAHGGRYIVRGAEPDVPEGDWPSAQRVVIVEFPTMERLQRWYASPEYAEALAAGHAALRRRLLFVAGVELRGRRAAAGQGLAGEHEGNADEDRHRNGLAQHEHA